MGDDRTYRRARAARRASKDGMTADWARLPTISSRRSSRVVNECAASTASSTTSREAAIDDRVGMIPATFLAVLVRPPRGAARRRLRRGARPRSTDTAPVRRDRPPACGRQRRHPPGAGEARAVESHRIVAENVVSDHVGSRSGHLRRRGRLARAERRRDQVTPRRATRGARVRPPRRGAVRGTGLVATRARGRHRYVDDVDVWGFGPTPQRARGRRARARGPTSPAGSTSS